MELLKVESISYSYGGEKPALNSVSAAFKKGERVAVLGENGAGKSTFFLCLNGVLRPQGGKLYYNGTELTSSKKDTYALRQAVGLVFQDPDSQIIAGSVENEISFGPMNLKLPKEEVSRRVELALAQMDLVRYREKAPQYISGGEKKRLTIGDVLAMEPEIILLDEPTASLDPRNTKILESILKELNSAGITIIISTHDVDFAYRFAERAVVFADGRIIADGSVCELFSQEETLNLAGLEKPLIYQAFRLMQKNEPLLQRLPMPKTIGELEKALSALSAK